jgi:universal stress protein E
MLACTKILAWVDLSGGRPDRKSLGPENDSTIRHALWAARASGARLTFCGASEKIREPLWVKPGAEKEPAAAKQTPAWNILADLLHEGEAGRVSCDAILLPQSGWEAIVRQVQRGSHDLLLVGNPAPRGLLQRLFSSTAEKLLRHCPCPVWVTRPGAEPQPRKILVASDLTELGEEAMRIAVWLGALADAEIHLVHAADFPLDRVWSTGEKEPWTQAYRQRIRNSAEAKLREQLRRAGSPPGRLEAALHVLDSHGLPDNAILKFVQENAINLLVLGTAGRGGIEAALVGNTAERLLPELTCELLAGKPANFVSPVNGR